MSDLGRTRMKFSGHNAWLLSITFGSKHIG
uniref:Uncharacterized protein n=1 Tax=Arundo donax TaxID=35708 RepID=A0A0A9BHZ0_ARUDO